MAKVRFEVECPDAKKVFIAGDFNDWAPQARALKRVRKGEPLFVAVLDLAPGRHQFKYVVDGEWCCCPKSPRATNNQGIENSVIDVPEEGA